MPASPAATERDRDIARRSTCAFAYPVPCWRWSSALRERPFRRSRRRHGLCIMGAIVIAEIVHYAAQIAGYLRRAYEPVVRGRVVNQVRTSRFLAGEMDLGRAGREDRPSRARPSPRSSKENTRRRSAAFRIAQVFDKPPEEVFSQGGRTSPEIRALRSSRGLGDRQRAA